MMISQAAGTPVFQQLSDVVRDVFGCQDVTLTRETTAFDVDGWDSLSHTVLLLRVESAFGIRLPLERVGTVATLGKLADLVQALTFPVAEPDIRAADRNVVIVHGNCQMHLSFGILRELLRPHGYEVVGTSIFPTTYLPMHPEPE